jgi:hypothetical protein
VGLDSTFDLQTEIVNELLQGGLAIMINVKEVGEHAIERPSLGGGL